MLPVKAATMAKIKDHLSGKMPIAPAFGLKVNHAALMIQSDLADARKKWIDDAKNDPAEYRRRVESDFLAVKTGTGKIDFHSLRHTFATFLVENGTDIKTAQSLLRHSTPALTLQVYTHSRDENLTAAVDNLPDFETEKKSFVRTGTDDFCVDAIGQKEAEKNTPKNTPILPAKHGINRHESAQVNGQNLKNENAVECNETGVSMQYNRRGRDSNPGCPYKRHDGLANRCLKPLGHLSLSWSHQISFRQKSTV